METHNLQNIVNILEACKRDNNLKGEIKWTKVTDQYLDKYINVIHSFFSFVKDGKIKVRIMFRRMNTQYPALYKNEKYFKLYYQFIKHAFGFMQTQKISPFNLRIYLDQLPAKREDCAKFKKFLIQMPDTAEFYKCALRISQEQIAEVRSHEHVLLQCIDIVMGAMHFRLNMHHKDKPSGSKIRSKRTIAKEKLYKAILKEIYTIHPKFNPSVSTGFREYKNSHWESPYEHWLFIPNKY